MRLRASVKVRNEHILAARERLGWSQHDLVEACRSFGDGRRRVQIADVLALEALKYDRLGTRAAFVRDAVAQALDLQVCDVLPSEAVGRDLCLDETRVAEVAVSGMLEARDRLSSRLIAGAPDELDFDPSDAQRVLEHVRAVLGKRYAQVLEMRFGIGCEAMTLEDVGRRLRVSRERVRQIERKALAVAAGPRIAITATPEDVKALEERDAAQRRNSLEERDAALRARMLLRHPGGPARAAGASDPGILGAP